MKKILCVLFLFLMIPAMVFAETEGQETIIEPGITAEEPIPEEEPPTEQEPVEQEEVLDETPGEENLEEETPEENEEEVPEEVPEEDVEEPSEPPQEEIPEEEIPDEEPQEPEIPEAPQEPEMPEEPEIPEEPIPGDWMPVPFSNRIPETMERLYFSNGDVMKNGYIGNAWLNQYENGYYNGIPQGRYVDHIDIRTGKASITINYHVNGEFRESKTQEAIVTNIKNIKIDGNDLKYISSESRSDNNEGEFNFQIAPMDDFNYSKWLDLKSVDQITFVCTLTVFDENGNAKDMFKAILDKSIGAIYFTDTAEYPPPAWHPPQRAWRCMQPEPRPA